MFIMLDGIAFINNTIAQVISFHPIKKISGIIADLPKHFLFYGMSSAGIVISIKRVFMPVLIIFFVRQSIFLHFERIIIQDFKGYNRGLSLYARVISWPVIKSRQYLF